MKKLKYLYAAALCLICSGAGVASAQNANTAGAEALFVEGRRLMAEGKFSEACVKLAASHAAEPAVGTQLNLALCYKKAGRTASAWTTYRSAAAASRKSGQLAREKLARDEAKALEPELMYVVIAIPQPAPAGLAITLDGNAIAPSLLNLRTPIDPGDHLLTATAPAHGSWEETITVSEKEATVVIPALESTGDPAVGVDVDGSGSNTLAWVAYGAGAAGLVTGVVGLLVAGSATDKLNDRALCDDDNECRPEAQQYIDQQELYSTISLVGFIVGGVGLATGTTLMLLPGEEESDPAQLEAYVGPGSLGLKGSF